MDKFCITLEISSPEIRKRGENKIGASVSTLGKYKNRDDVKKRAVFQLFLEIIRLLEKILETRIYTDSFKKKFNLLYEEYFFDQPEKVENIIRRMTGELFDSSVGIGIIVETCEAKLIYYADLDC